MYDTMNNTSKQGQQGFTEAEEMLICIFIALA